MTTPTPPTFLVRDALPAYDDFVAEFIARHNVSLVELLDLPLFVLFAIERDLAELLQDVNNERDLAEGLHDARMMKLAKAGVFERADRCYAIPSSTYHPAKLFKVDRLLRRCRAYIEDEQADAQLRAAVFAGRDLVRQTTVFPAKPRKPAQERKSVRWLDLEDPTQALSRVKFYYKGERMDDLVDFSSGKVDAAAAAPSSSSSSSRVAEIKARIAARRAARQCSSTAAVAPARSSQPQLIRAGRTSRRTTAAVAVQKTVRFVVAAA